LSESQGVVPFQQDLPNSFDQLRVIHDPQGLLIRYPAKRAARL
jgi:hypothetical protein